MSGSGRRGALAPRFAWTFAAPFLCLVLPARLAYAGYSAGPAGVAVAAALFVLPLLYTVPRGRVVWARHRGWMLAAQAVLTYLPFSSSAGTGSRGCRGSWAACCCSPSAPRRHGCCVVRSSR